MEFGIFMEFETREGESQPEAFRSAFELIDAAEAWGLDAVWLGEMHFTPTRSVLSEPIVVASAIAARTERLRLGVAVRVLPLSHPLRIAEETATLDQISEGRLDFGIGRSGSPRSYDARGVPYGESQARFREALGVIIEAWKGEPFSHHGEFFSFDKIAVAPRTYQQPHPPLWLMVSSERTVTMAAERGFNAMAVGTIFGTHKEVFEVGAFFYDRCHRLVSCSLPRDEKVSDGQITDPGN